jgi:cytochrome P450
MPRPGYARARRELDDYLYQIIDARRNAPGQADDLLGLLVATPGLSDEIIRDQLLTMLIAGHDTSTALLAWALYLLGRHPAVLAQAQAEVEAVLGCQPPTLAHVSELRYLEQVINETLRLYPPIHTGLRLAAEDLEFQGYRIPAGTRVMYSIYLTHRLAEYWPEPDRFDPDRFSPERGHARPPYTFLPFGGGPRNCIGLAFARVEAKVVLARILQNFDLKLTRTSVRPGMGATLEPRPGVVMQVRRRHQAQVFL